MRDMDLHWPSIALFDTGFRVGHRAEDDDLDQLEHHFHERLQDAEADKAPILGNNERQLGEKGQFCDWDTV